MNEARNKNLQDLLDQVESEGAAVSLPNKGFRDNLKPSLENSPCSSEDEIMRGVEKNVASMEKRDKKKKRKHLNRGDSEQKSKKNRKEDKIPKCFDKFRSNKEGSSNLNENELELH